MSSYAYASCRNCPTTLNEEWGHQERVGINDEDGKVVAAWAGYHTWCTGHTVDRGIGATMDVSFGDFDRAILNKFVGER